MFAHKILVTGSSGTIGTRFCEKLLEHNLLEHNIDFVGVDWKENKWNKAVEQKTKHLDLRNAGELQRLSIDADLIVHLAAHARVYDLIKDPGLARDNILTLFNALEFARQNNIKKIIFSSSREVYGELKEVTSTEKDGTIGSSESPYAASKIAGEALLWAYQRCFGIDFVILRFANVYGRYDESNRFVPLMIGLCRTGKDITIFGKDKLLDFIYIDDVVNGILLASEKFDAIKNDVYNISSGVGSNLVEVAELIKAKLGALSSISIAANRTGEVMQCIANNSKAKEKLGFVPEVDINEGIKRSIEWYVANT